MRLAVGDWVTERATRPLISPNPWSPSYQKVKELIKGPRKGQVVELFEKQGAKGRKTVYARVLWSGSARPSVHGAMRLVAIEEPAPSLP